jgi:sterol desaturase/sphingolipid hydroxylase (fatty acid hydroxylase superfamily)
MMDSGALRIGIFITVLLSMLLLEIAIPRRTPNFSKPVRWSTNLLMIVIDTIVVRLLLPITSLGVALYATTNEWGLLHLFSLPVFVEALIAILLLDLGIYAQHVASHKIPLLWRVHRVHHTDPDIDTTTGIRFHPVEIILSMLYKFVLILLVGPTVMAVLIFEIVLNSTALFNHANIRLPARLDKILRLILVTPDVHRVHHSVITGETDSNYGFNLTIWDRLFGTWIEQPEKGHIDMEIGLLDYRHKKPTELPWCLMLPFRN